MSGPVQFKWADIPSSGRHTSWLSDEWRCPTLPIHQDPSLAVPEMGGAAGNCAASIAASSAVSKACSSRDSGAAAVNAPSSEATRKAGDATCESNRTA